MVTSEPPLAPTTGGGDQISLPVDWDHMTRIILMLLLVLWGCMWNGLLISSLFIDNRLKTAGNAYLGNICVADFMVTAGVLPASVFVLMTGFGDNTFVCRVQLYFWRVSTTVVCLSYMFVAHENLRRFYGTLQEYRAKYSPARVTWNLFLLWASSASVNAVGVLYDHDFCDRKGEGEIVFRIITGVLMTALPILISIYDHLRTILCIYIYYRDRAYMRPRHKRVSVGVITSRRCLNRNSNLALINMLSFYLFLASWIPYTTNLIFYQDTSNETFYLLAWIGLIRPCVAPLIYIANRRFRSTFKCILNYCWRECAASRDCRPVPFRPYRGATFDHVLRAGLVAADPGREAHSRGMWALTNPLEPRAPYVDRAVFLSPARERARAQEAMEEQTLDDSYRRFRLPRYRNFNTEGGPQTFMIPQRSEYALPPM